MATTALERQLIRQRKHGRLAVGAIRSWLVITGWLPPQKHAAMLDKCFRHALLFNLAAQVGILFFKVGILCTKVGVFIFDCLHLVAQQRHSLSENRGASVFSNQLFENVEQSHKAVFGKQGAKAEAICVDKGA